MKTRKKAQEGGAHRRRWLERERVWLQRMGPLLTALKVEQRAASVSRGPETRADVRRKIRRAIVRGELIDIVDGRRRLYPQFQFVKDGQPAFWVREMAKLLPDQFSRLQFFGGARIALKGRTFAALLAANPDDPEVGRQILDHARATISAEER